MDTLESHNDYLPGRNFVIKISAVCCGVFGWWARFPLKCQWMEASLVTKDDSVIKLLSLIFSTKGAHFWLVCSWIYVPLICISMCLSSGTVPSRFHGSAVKGNEGRHRQYERL
jgi:hypothetical protein